MITREKFDRIANDVWKRLQPVIPPELKAHFEKFRIMIEDSPPPEVLAELDAEMAEYPEELCGLYLGTPLPDTALTQPNYFQDRVYLFREALLEEADHDEAKLKEEIAITLLHEVGHFFGLDEDDLERLGFD